MFLSGLIAFLLSNVYYQIKLKPYNDRKITQMASNIASFYETHPTVNLDHYLKGISHLGFQMLLIKEDKQKVYYGKPFSQHNLTQSTINQVLRGETYHGIVQFPKQAFVTGFFDDELRNTIGVPIDANGKNYALFIRPDIEYQFGEMRIFFAVLVALMIGLSVLLVFIGAYYIVKPIRVLSRATQKIAHGDYNIQLHVNRRDEIGQLAQHFTQMARSLERLEEMRQEFVSNVSHEIQSPLASIQGFSKTLQANDLPPEQHQHYLSIIEEESSRLSLLSKQLLTLASLDRDKGELDITSFDLADQMKQAVLMTEWGWREKELAIDMDLPSTIIQGDSKLLYQVWINLITNSIKFTEKGGMISLQIVNTSKKEVVVRIEDSGIGIPKQDLPYIFDRFYKVDKARKRNHPGSGLGLSIAKKIIELHFGSIEVISAEGKGTTFIIHLPYM
jgi:signal transduction histidine kinase